eukprot:146468_1
MKQIALIIVGKIRSVFKKDSTSIKISDLTLLRITNRMNQLVGIHSEIGVAHTEIMQTAWNNIRQYRYEYNNHIMMNSGLLQHIQIGLSKSNKFDYKINNNYSILTYWALLRHKNQTNPVHKIHTKRCIEEYINLNKQQCKFKIGKGGAYSTDSVFQQLDIVSTTNIYPG